MDALEDGKEPGEALAKRLRTREAECERLRAKLDELRKPASQSYTATTFDLDRIRPYIESLKETLSSAPTKTQRAILKSFIKRIDVSEGTIQIEFSIPDPGRNEPPHPEPDVLGMVASGTPDRIRTCDLWRRRPTL